jgi:hypothetical protein
MYRKAGKIMRGEAKFVSHLLFADETKNPADKHNKVDRREQGKIWWPGFLPL